jgi:hypothetical protein
MKINRVTLVPFVLLLLTLPALASAQMQWHAIGPQGSVWDITVSNGKTYVLTTDGLYVSADDKNWATLRTIPKTEFDYSVVALPSGELFLFSYNSYQLSTDAGVTWKKTTQTGFPPRQCVTDALGYLYAGENDPIQRSTDKGKTWSASKQGTSANFFDIGVLSLADNGVLYAGNQGITGGMVYRTSNHGASWRLVHAENTDDVQAISGDFNSIWIAYSDKIIYSDDDGATWNEAAMTPTLCTSLLFTGENELFGGTFSTGLAYSADRGNSWTTDMIGIRGKSVRKLVRSAMNSVLVGTDSGLFTITSPSDAVRGSGTAAPQIALWPNPAKGEVRITVAQPNGGLVRFEVRDALGRIVSANPVATEQNRYVLNTLGLPTGAYELLTFAGSTPVATKFVVSR